MIRFRLRLADLAATSFGYSPLQEAVLSLRMWTHHAHRFPALRPAFAALRPAFERLDAHPLLTALVARRRYWVPDLLTPRPAVPAPALRDELAALRATDPARLRPGLEQTFHPLGEPVPPVLAAGLRHPDRLLADLADALETYWHTCLAPHWWPRARTVLTADLAHRARTLAEGGADALFHGISARLSWADDTLTIRRGGPWPSTPDDIPVDGRRLLLTPSCFADGVSTMLDRDAPPHIVYATRGLATLAERPPPPAPQALTGLLGATRARLLVLLADDGPATTTELAHRLAVTPAAVSRHLTALRTAALLERTRHGRHVHYRPTPLGAALRHGEPHP
ncbi:MULTISPECIES: winged helix-turn-helix domain-containing protein [Kitasatospora]|uniref:Putative ArsR family transcriptional regulator n=1 Tax=Kitasatospora setae (strain ATCC 33774 / DSM 43861 / JCM 3304 / KCC A-0304 / NBRC 14216 / KM-6054) TaxID=452652 RepID=E4N218_KITSK|nr:MULTISPECIES: winged helix-turn-helix domain-containing protein [Kitasatospora]BAJ32202.1 putative ArsR family transcriptional regulator [Kitasatospora setae KM-6054]